MSLNLKAEVAQIVILFSFCSILSQDNEPVALKDVNLIRKVLIVL